MKCKEAVAVAQDVLDQLRAGTTNFKQGCYFIWNDGRPNSLWHTDSAQKNINLISKNCRVCEMGGLLLSYVRLFNKLNVGDVEDCAGPETIMHKLKNVFTKTELRSMECIFEGYNVGNFLSNTQVNKCLKYRDQILKDAHLGQFVKVNDHFRFPTEHELKRNKRQTRAIVRATMNNIIENEGRFIVPSV